MSPYAIQNDTNRVSKISVKLEKVYESVFINNMNILFYLILSVISFVLYTWIKQERWIHKNRPGNDIPRNTYKQTYSQKQHLQLYNTNTQITTINMFIESYRLLDLNLFTREELSEQMINDAYNKKLNEHVNCIQKSLEPEFDIIKLKSAREYLIQTLNNPRKPNNRTIN